MLRLLLTIYLLTALPLQGENRVVLITGASRGVGLATARLLAEQGFTVYGTIRGVPPGQWPFLHFLQVDLRDEASIHQTAQAILEREDRIDVLINNAGYALVGPVESLSGEEIQEQMDINFFAPVRWVQALLPSMRERKVGQIINISSTNAINTCSYGSLYAASKAALESFSESLCIEVEPFNISVSIVEPGFLSTHFSCRLGSREIENNPYYSIEEEIDAALQKRLAHPELLPDSQTPEEIALILFEIIQDDHPKLRYQTSDAAKKDVSHKLLDLTGEAFRRLQH